MADHCPCAESWENLRSNWQGQEEGRPGGGQARTLGESLVTPVFQGPALTMGTPLLMSKAQYRHLPSDATHMCF